MLFNCSFKLLSASRPFGLRALYKSLLLILLLLQGAVALLVCLLLFHGGQNIQLVHTQVQRQRFSVLINLLPILLVGECPVKLYTKISGCRQEV